MRTKMQTADEVLTEVTVDDALHGLGLELMMKSEELIYATRSLDEAGCEELGSDLYLLARVVGNLLLQHSKRLKTLSYTLPPDVGVVRVKNPYFFGGSESPEDKSTGRSAEGGDVFPF